MSSTISISRSRSIVPTTAQLKEPRKQAQKLNPFLLLCCLTTATGSFQFGYNVSSLNPCTYIIQSFVKKNFFLFGKLNASPFTTTTEIEYLNATTSMYWIVLNNLFIVGGIAGALASKSLTDLLSRRHFLLAHNVFSMIGGLLAFLTPYLNSPVCLLISRFLFGVHDALTCSIIPVYLSEISHVKLRGQVGFFQQLGFTAGFVFAQVVGLRQLLGIESLWHVLVAGPFLIAIFANILIYFFLPDTPYELVQIDRNRAKLVLKRLRATHDVNEELQAIVDKISEGKQEPVTIKRLFTIKELRWPLIISTVLTLSQQLSGSNAIFFYSAGIFKSAGLVDSQIQYAILSTGVALFLTTLVSTTLIDRLGRKPLLVCPIIVIIVIFIAMTIFLTLKDRHVIYSYLAVACLLLYIISFAVSLGPIPFLYAAECMRADARSSALSFATLLNWLASLVTTLLFPLLIASVGQYVFLGFSGIMLATAIVLHLKMVESKDKSSDEIIELYNI